MPIFLGTLWSSIKEIKVPFVFDGEHGIAVNAMQGNRASFRSEGEVSLFFSSCSRKMCYSLELQRGWPFTTRVCSATSGLLSSCEGLLGTFLEAWQINRDASLDEVGYPIPFQLSQ